MHFASNFLKVRSKGLVSAFLLLLAVAASLSGSYVRVAHASQYNLVVDDSFQRADTTPVAGANSIGGVGNGWVDWTGGNYQISGHQVCTCTATVPIFSGVLYHHASSSDSFQNGKVDIWTVSGGGTADAAVGRFDPTGGGSGYAALLYANTQLFLYKEVNGSTQGLVGGLTITGVPTSAILELAISDADSTHTQLVVNFYDPSSPSVVAATYSYIDSSSPIQAAGYWGATEYNKLVANEIAISSYASGGPIVPGIASVVPGTIYKNTIDLSSLAATGGVGTLSYQWQRSTSSNSGFVNIPNATGITLHDSGLSPGVTYYYQLVVTDSTPGTPQIATSSVVPVTTVGTSGHIIGFIGDSITAGLRSSGGTDLTTADAEYYEYLTLLQDGYQVGQINEGLSGTTAAYWDPGNSTFQSSLSAFESVGVDTVSIMLGSNDAGLNSQSVSAYKAAMQTLVNALLAPGTGITRVVLNYSPYTSMGYSDTVGTDALILAYEPALQQIAASTPGVSIGDTQVYTVFQANQNLLLDGVHPTEVGYQTLGALWTTGYVKAFSSPSSVQAVPTLNSATITWNTNEIGTTAQVNYGLTASYGSQSSLDSTMATSHSQTLSGLSSGTTYHYDVVSTDTLGNVLTSADQTFTTASPPPTSSGGGGGGAPGAGTTLPSSPSTSSQTNSAGSGSHLVNDNGTFYLISGSSKRGITNPGILESYGYTFGQATAITPSQLALPTTSNLAPNNGALVKTASDPTVYLISGGQRYGFSSESVFTALGYKFSSVLTVTTPELNQLPVASPLTDGTKAHMAGTNVLWNGTVYWIGDDHELHAYPSLDVYNSWNVANDFSTVVPANVADEALLIGAVELSRS